MSPKLNYSYYIYYYTIAEYLAKMLLYPQTVFLCPCNCGRSYNFQHQLLAHNDFGCPKQYWKLRICRICWKSCSPVSSLRAHMILAHNVISD